MEELARAIESAVNAAAEVVAGAVESLGNVAADALGGRGLPGWLGAILAGLLGLVAAVLKGGLGVAGGTLAGLVRILRGRVGTGLGDVAASAAGALIVILGKLVAAIQAMLALHGAGRALTEPEQALLRRTFGSSVALHQVRLVTGFAGLFSLNRRPFTLGNTIYLKNRDPDAHPATLVHECAHVWQHQHEGARYTFDALWAQATVRPNAYHWQDELGRGRVHWRQFNKEAQAQFLEDLYRFGGDGAEFTRGGKDYGSFARETVAHVQGVSGPAAGPARWPGRRSRRR